MTKETIIHIGNSVACDFCNEDFTNRDDVGGILWGTYAVCPDCCKDYPLYRKPSRYVKGMCPEGMSFRDWVISLRKGDNTIRIISKDQ